MYARVLGVSGVAVCLFLRLLCVQVWCEGKGVTSRWRLSPGEVPRGTQDGSPVSITYSDLWRSLVVCWASGKVDVLSIKGAFQKQPRAAHVILWRLSHQPRTNHAPATHQPCTSHARASLHVHKQ